MDHGRGQMDLSTVGPGERGLWTDESKQAQSLDDILEQVKTCLACKSEPVLHRFHSLRPLVASPETEFMQFVIEVGHRGAKAQPPYQTLLGMRGSSALQLIGARFRESKTHEMWPGQKDAGNPVSMPTSDPGQQAWDQPLPHQILSVCFVNHGNCCYVNTWLLSYLWLHGVIRKPLMHRRMQDLWRMLVQAAEAGLDGS